MMRRTLIPYAWTAALPIVASAQAITVVGTNVGIGTTSPADKVEIVGDLRIHAQADGQAIKLIGRSDGFSQLAFYSDAAGTYSGVLQFYADGTITVGNTASLSERMKITASGFVGIGTPNPGAKLEVDGNIRLPSVDFRSDNGTSSDRPYLRGTPSHLVVAPATSGGTMYLAYPGDLAAGANIATRLQETLFISSTASGGNGNVGIGTANPVEKLQVAGGSLGMSLQGEYGDAWGKWIAVGAHDFSGYPLYLGAEKVGTGVIWDSDGAFFGLSNEGSNRKDAIIAWGDDADDSLRFLFNNTETARITAVGNFGLGVANPEARLHVKNGADTAILAETTTGNAYIALRNAGGSSSISSSGNTLFIGDGGAAIYFRNGAGWDIRMAIAASGNVGIGTTNPSEKLTVNGTIKARGVRVDTSDWADFVFRPGYQLPSLSDVEAQVSRDGHLSDFPSEAEVKRNGIDIADTQVRLLRKIEELMLYQIQQNKRLEAQELRIRQLESENRALIAPKKFD